MTTPRPMLRPNISRAIPKQRYKLGAYTIVVLDSIESKDQVEYECMLAAIEDGRDEPEVFITCEKSQTEPATDDRLVRVFATQLGEEASGRIVDSSSQWASRDAFVSYALSGFQQMLQLQDEKPVPIT
ncbi:MAG: hypothetical protein OXC42_06155 [Gammaproteobacteria bacterium]|nr:hypothetical protein [Gammaproteobacteria bacterium]